MVEGNGLENRRWATIREFESHLLRQIKKESDSQRVAFFCFKINSLRSSASFFENVRKVPKTPNGTKVAQNLAQSR